MDAPDPRDDFGIFAGSEHMFFGLSEPFGLVREEITRNLEQQVPGTQVDAILCYDEPKWLTLGRKLEHDPDRVVVGHFGVCFRCAIDVVAPDHAERLDATVTLLFRDVDRPDDARMRVTLDLHRDAESGFDDEVFEERFLGFRNEVP